MSSKKKSIYMKKVLKQSLPLAEGISKLLHPFAEVVLHDLEKDQVEAIFNPFSRREPGDNSYLDRLEFEDNTSIIGPYEKTNWDGRALKCISIVLRDEMNKPSGFLCVNMDVSHFSSLAKVFTEFLGNNATISEDESRLFKDDLYERINKFVQAYCRESQASLQTLNRESRRELIGLLEAEGAFRNKNAATYIGRVLGVSRATVYNDLKQTE